MRVISKKLKSFINFFLKLFYPIFKKWLPFQVYAYLGVGAANTLLNIVLFAIFYEVLPKEGIVLFNQTIASYTIALIIAFILTVPSGFWLAKYFAFTGAEDNRKENQKQLGKYFLVVLQGLISDYLILKLLIVFTGMHPTIAKTLSTVIVLTVNFILQKYFTFRDKKGPKSADSGE
jgi:putative flippase GtrA